jgi:hypothetical protein
VAAGARAESTGGAGGKHRARRLQASKTFKLVSRATSSQFREQYLLDQRNGTLLDQYEDNREQLGHTAERAAGT